MNNMDIEIRDAEYTDDMEIIPNVIHNRFDIKYGSRSFVFVKSKDGRIYSVPLYIDEKYKRICLGLYMRKLPDEIFSELIEFFFKKKYSCIYIKGCMNSYEGKIKLTPHWSIDLPPTREELLARRSKKSRYNLRREERKLQERGVLEYKHWQKEDIPLENVTCYFHWKQITHGSDYMMSEREYLQEYSVSDCYGITIDGKLISVLFSCEQCPCAFFENFSYDKEYVDYSVGMLLYLYYLSQMIENGISTVYLGGGKHEYKKHFGSDEVIAGDCLLYRNILSKYRYLGVRKIEILIKKTIKS